MKNAEPSEFNARCDRLGQTGRDIIAFLVKVAENAGAEVERPTFEVRGTGVTYWRRGKRFCRFDPKHRPNHVWAFVPRADRLGLERAGTVSRREDGVWITVRTMREAVRLVPHILRSYDSVIVQRRR